MVENDGSRGVLVRAVESTYHAGEVEESVREFWRGGDIYRKVRDLRSGGKPFFFVDGPPYTTGNIHLGTAWNKILKDAIIRYHRLKGRHVIERAGYDMHGLPIEVKVEHNLGFSSKKEIETFGIGAFIDECRRFALGNMKVMSDQFRRLGVWLDFDDPYLTVAPAYIEAAWWTLARAGERKMLERGHRVVNWCPRCETAIADSEVEYWERKDPSIFVKFPVKGREGEYLVIWTTTPWTLPANVAAAVQAGAIYARVRAEKDGRTETLWMADDLVEQVLRKGRYQDFNVLEKVLGRELIGLEYESPLADKVPFQREYTHKVTEADFVTLENTGIVHIAPGHGWDDYLLGMKEGLPIFCPVDGTAGSPPMEGPMPGIFVKDADGIVLEDLGEDLMAKGEVVHRYGHCWRCKTPIIFRATSQWFLKASEIREQMLAECAAVTWYPGWAGSARFYDWLKEARDWCISRQRYWGIPIPIWECGSLHRPQDHRHHRRARGPLGGEGPRPPPAVRGLHHDPLRLRRDDAPGRGHLRCLVRLGGCLLGDPRLPRRTGEIREVLARRLYHRGAGPDEGLVLLPARGIGHRLLPLALPERAHARLRPRCRGPEDVEEPGERRRPRGGHREGRGGRAQALHPLGERPVGRPEVQLGRGEDGEPGGEHPLERLPLPPPVHDPGRVRTSR